MVKTYISGQHITHFNNKSIETTIRMTDTNNINFQSSHNQIIFQTLQETQVKTTKLSCHAVTIISLNFLYGQAREFENLIELLI